MPCASLSMHTDKHNDCYRFLVSVSCSRDFKLIQLLKETRYSTKQRIGERYNSASFAIGNICI